MVIRLGYKYFRPCSLSCCSVIFLLLLLLGLKLLLNQTLALFLCHLGLGSFVRLSCGFASWLRFFSRSGIGGRSFLRRCLFLLCFLLLLGFFLGLRFRLRLWLGLLYLCFLDSWCFLGFALFNFSFSIDGSRLWLFTLFCIFFFDSLCLLLALLSFLSFRWNKIRKWTQLLLFLFLFFILLLFSIIPSRCNFEDFFSCAFIYIWSVFAFRLFLCRSVTTFLDRLLSCLRLLFKIVASF